MRKGTLKLDSIQAMVLDEADEMLRMGFIEEVQWILERTRKPRQTALFSATMPKEIQQIARKHLREPREISVKAHQHRRNHPAALLAGQRHPQARCADANSRS